MSVEVLVFFYMTVSLAMGLFEFVYLQHERIHLRYFSRLSSRTIETLSREIRENADFPTEEHKATLARSLHKMSGAEAFDLTMDKLLEEGDELSRRYLRGIADVFCVVAPRMSRKPDLHKAYFAYLLSKWYQPADAPAVGEGNAVLHFLHESVHSPSLYVRQNAIDALAQLGDASDLNDALLWACSDSSVFYHPRLLTETAMAFKGSRAELAANMRASYADYPESAHPAIINFWRMSNTGDADQLIGFLEDGALDAEVRMAAMRYFGSHHDERAYPVLMRLADDREPVEWEYAVVACTALAAYPTAEAIALLKRALSSQTWFVRNAAAQSLVRIAEDHDVEFADILEGDDRYAREMLTYHIENAAPGAPATAGADADAAVDAPEVPDAFTARVLPMVPVLPIVHAAPIAPATPAGGESA